MVMFHSYVSLPEGIIFYHIWYTSIFHGELPNSPHLFISALGSVGWHVVPPSPRRTRIHPGELSGVWSWGIFGSWSLEKELGKLPEWKFRLEFFLCFFQGYDMLWYLPIEKIHYKYLWPWVGSNVDDPLGVVAIVSLSIRNDVRKNRAWSYLQPKWNLLWMVISRFVGQTSKSGAFQFQI